ncbi:substrate-binding domain-containing protein [Streptomyces actuosus]|uniref:Substrate-binding domain-containing protein n=1 Tax=Streptomyces actuosus TaxID=1885 RepID=A0ABS2VK25_STRAS|nr:substrate-binding domain-containing protein [Streptomyces actuosus]MBN0043433.1 substrate-binding domain-containing protein [Streptomyces actuosus]
MNRYDPRGKVNGALLVGVSEYDHVRPDDREGVPGQLPGVRHNRLRLRDALHRTGLFETGRTTDCASPSHDVFNEALRHVARETEGLLLLYFAGHAIVTKAGDELFLQMSNARVVAGGHDAFPNAVPLTEVLAQLVGSRAERVVVVLDCCYAGNAVAAWHRFDHRMRRKALLLMSVQSNRLIDAGDGGGATPFTEELVHVLSEEGELSVGGLYARLKERMAAAGHRTALDDAQDPQGVWEPGEEVLLRSGGVSGPEDLEPDIPEPANPETESSSTGPVRLRAAVRSAAARMRGLRLRFRLLLALVLLAAGCGGWGIARLIGHDGLCAPPLELRVLTDPELEPTVDKAADTFLDSDANTQHGCRRAGITVYSADAADTVTALRERTDAWQEPLKDDDDPQRDIGPQPDVWIPATVADVTRVVVDRPVRSYADLEPEQKPLAYSPTVLAVPENLAADRPERTGRPLAELLDALKQLQPPAETRRPDPEHTDSALLATMGLYADGGRARTAEQELAQPGVPAPTAAKLLCDLPEDAAVDRRTAALVPEFLLKSGVACKATNRVPRVAEYPRDVPALQPAFVRVRWKDADRDEARRNTAVQAFRDWLYGDGGRQVLGAAGFRSADAGHPLLARESAEGVLDDPGRSQPSAERLAMTAALQQYRSANGPGRVLFLLDSSGSMGTWWQGATGGPGLIRQSLGGLGDQDEYGVWAMYGTSGDGYAPLLSFGRHKRADAERILLDASRTAVHEVEADPHRALLAALGDMARRGGDDDRPQLIVLITDDEDNNRLTGGNRTAVLDLAAESGVPVAVVSLDGGGCGPDRVDAQIAAAAGGRCLDTGDDLGPALHDEVARTGTGAE